jgi:hypothetical protein
MTLREHLHHQIDRLPDDILQTIADFMFFVMERRNITPTYTEWSNKQWQNFSLEQFFREEDEVEYFLSEAKEVYHP